MDGSFARERVERHPVSDLGATPATSCPATIAPCSCGARPYTFTGRDPDEWHAPGVVVTKHGNTQCAVDAAWLVERAMGKPVRAPSMWPGVPGARERAIWGLGQQLGLPVFQQEGAAFLAERDYAHWPTRWAASRVTQSCT